MFKSVSVIDYSLESIVLSTSPYNRLTLTIDCMFDLAIWQFQRMQMPLVGFLSFCVVYIYVCMHKISEIKFPNIQFVPTSDLERERELFLFFFSHTHLHTVIHTHTLPLPQPEEKRRRGRSPEPSRVQRRSRTPLKLKLEASQDPHYVSSRCEYFYSLSYLNIYIYKNLGKTMLEMNVAYLVFIPHLYSARLLETTTFTIDYVV